MFFGSLVPVDLLCFVSRFACMAMRLDRVRRVDMYTVGI
jgi:hypothetical protein